MAKRNDIHIEWTLSPRVIVIEAGGPDEAELTIQDLVDTCRFLESELSGMDDEHLINATGKQDLGGEVFVGITAELNNAQVMFESRTSPLSNNTVTSSQSPGTILTDSAADFITDGIYTGCVVHNDTTDAIGTVLEIIDLHNLRHEELSGGSSANWTNGNKYLVYPNVQCTISGGNLVAINNVGGSMDPVHPSANVQIIMTSASSATFSELEAIQYSSYQNAIWLDTGSANSGTEYPMGTREYPVNSMTDALSIANNKGFDTIQILSSMAVNAGSDLENFIIVGKSMVNTILTIDTSALVQGITIKDANVSGVLDGDTHIRCCMVGNVTYVNGQICQSGLYGTITLDGNEDAVLISCGTVDVNSPPTVDMNGSGQDVIVQDFSGDIVFANMDGDNNIYIQLDGGKVTLDSSIEAGSIFISGIGTLIDNSTGTATVNSGALLSNDSIAGAIWDANAVDHDGANTFGKKFKSLAKSGDVWAR